VIKKSISSQVVNPSIDTHEAIIDWNLTDLDLRQSLAVFAALSD